MGFKTLTVVEQLAKITARVNDPRGTIPTGIGPLDADLHRGGLAPSTMVLLGGRTGTRKTTLTCNMVARLLKQDTNVGVVGLDEAAVAYPLKIMSAMYGIAHEKIEETWNDKSGRELRERFTNDAARLTTSLGYRPSWDDLDAWMDEASVQGIRPQVVFIDYLGLLGGEQGKNRKYAGQDVTRIPRVAEDLQVWTNTQDIVTIALHQVGRQDDTSRRYHGDLPMTVEQLKYGGEEYADIVLSTYRPAKDPIGNMTFDEAQAHNEKITEEEWERHKFRVERYANSTMLQLLKNRPGVRTNEQGIELISVSETMKMHPAEGD